MHSPFVFDFIIHVLNDDKDYPVYKTIEAIRQQLLNNETVIEIEDFGAGSTALKSNTRVVKNIAKTSLKPKKYAQLLFRIAQYYKPAPVVELGTSLGITTAYLALSNPAATVYTGEGSSSIAAIAKNNFDQLQLKNIEIVEGDFNATLPSVLNKFDVLGLGFIDGNHRKEPTLVYFEQLLKKVGASSIIIFDDIHWSSDMEAAWDIIKDHPAVTLTIDLFFIGLVFVNPDFKVKQHFAIRF